MFEHHTKTLGDLGVLKAQVDLFEKGYLILEPKTEHAPFDLVIYKENVFKRVQVKARSLNNRGHVTIKFSSSYSTSTGVHTNYVDKDSIDVYCIYIPELDKCYYLNPKDYNASVNLRSHPAKNGQEKGIHLLSNFESINF